jgi:hypothetical protein
MNRFTFNRDGAELRIWGAMALTSFTIIINYPGYFISIYEITTEFTRP